jgi:hypothetical protein
MDFMLVWAEGQSHVNMLEDLHLDPSLGRAIGTGPVPDRHKATQQIALVSVFAVLDDHRLAEAVHGEFTEINRSRHAAMVLA